MDENEEQTVIVDEIYLIRLQSEIKIMREALKKIADDLEINTVEKCMVVAQTALDKTIGL